MWPIAVPEAAEATIGEVMPGGAKKKWRQGSHQTSSRLIELRRYSCVINQMTTLTAIVRKPTKPHRTTQKAKIKSRKNGPTRQFTNRRDRHREQGRRKQKNESSKKKKNKKRSKNYFYESCYSSESDDTYSKLRKLRMLLEREDLRIPVSGLPPHLNVSESDQIAPASIIGKMEQSGSIPFTGKIVRLSAATRAGISFMRKVGRDLAFNEMGWEATVSKKLWTWPFDGY